MTQNTAIYLRVSTEEQAKDGYGLDAQLTKCTAMATVKGWTIDKIYKDEGISGTTSKRPGLQAMLQAVCNGEHKAVIVMALDRLARNTMLALQIINTLDECNAEIVSCKESLDTSNPMGKFFVTMTAALTQLDRDQIVERTTDGRNARGRIDGEKGGRLPLGYKRDLIDGRTIKKQPVKIHEKNAEIVREIFSLRSDGLSIRKIASAMNDKEILNPNNVTGEWSKNVIHIILKNADKYQGGPRNDSPIHWPEIL